MGDQHCPSCTCGRRAPVQASRKHNKAAGTISWAEHLEAWSVYGSRHSGQSAERIAERCGFGYGELIEFLGHEPTSYVPGRCRVRDGEQG